MKVDFGQQNNNEEGPIPQSGRVVVSANPVRQRVFIDIDGNEYDSMNPRTRKLIRRAGEK